MLLPVLAAGLADAFQRLMRRLAVGLAAKVAEADDAAQAVVLVDHRQAADLRFAHLDSDVLDIVVHAGADNAAGHDVANRRVRSVTFRDAAYGDVAIGDHADQAVAFGDRHRAG